MSLVWSEQCFPHVQTDWPTNKWRQSNEMKMFRMLIDWLLHFSRTNTVTTSQQIKYQLNQLSLLESFCCLWKLWVCSFWMSVVWCMREWNFERDMKSERINQTKTKSNEKKWNTHTKRRKEKSMRRTEEREKKINPQEYERFARRHEILATFITIHDSCRHIYKYTCTNELESDW